ncbi:hypothetical protein SLEP1_g32442 [Rubroshorea leprosula]|uniref:Uncharacterized protein n=1 Tax=Rubroshorea leprosula TaxID=152421 RepID=A0AAV5KDA3_9ROSI|nr:hypothetical protein SLEP1_g32442 [Rubroshorea leprosula]
MALSCTLAWNYRTFGEIYSVLESNQFGLQHMPNTILLPATNQPGMEMNLFRIDLELDHVSVCNCAERRGGLTLLWSEENNLQVSFFSPLIDLGLVLLFCRQLCIEKPSHIDVVIVDPSGCQWPSTGYFGQPEMVSPMTRRRLGDFKDFFSKSTKERGFLRFQLISAGGAKRRECRWRLIGDVGGVLQGENATSISKGALVPLLKFGNKGLQRIGIVRIMVGSPWRRGRCLGLYGGALVPSC